MTELRLADPALRASRASQRTRFFLVSLLPRTPKVCRMRVSQSLSNTSRSSTEAFASAMLSDFYFDRCNDKENDRFGYDAVVSERAFREVYLMPFMLAQKIAKPWVRI